ncbi:copper homeostasis CutC domain-containing protein [Cubamyces menziesii]|nr:copper homeostasis CutC domain-containing protein [Cubamyces menziesii]
MSKIDKVLLHIAAKDDLPRDDEFHFRERAQNLIQKWQPLLLEIQEAKVAKLQRLTSAATDSTSEAGHAERRDAVNVDVGPNDTTPSCHDSAPAPVLPADPQTSDLHAMPTIGQSSDTTPSTSPTTERITIEVCIDSVESAIAAVRGGADRLELCGNLALGGGTTPSIGLFKAVRVAAPQGLPIMVMIRPRTGDFLYTDAEHRVMREDIKAFKEAGADGVVLGILQKDGKIDVARTKTLAEEAAPMQVCFHRAIDLSSQDLLSAHLDISSIPQVTRILTSGQASTAPSPSALPHLRLLLRTASRMPSFAKVLVGSGVNAQTVGPLLAELLPCGLREVHLSAGGWTPSEMEFRREGMGMGVGREGEWAIWRTSEQKVREVRELVDKAWLEYVEREKAQ